MDNSSEAVAWEWNFGSGPASNSYWPPIYIQTEVILTYNWSYGIAQVVQILY